MHLQIQPPVCACTHGPADWTAHASLYPCFHSKLKLVDPQTSEADLCLSYYEHQCAGICSSEKRLGPIYRSCLQDPLRTGANPGSIPKIEDGASTKDASLELKEAKDSKDTADSKDSSDPKEAKGSKDPEEPKAQS